MACQSIRGASAMAAILKDSRVRAGIDMDGRTYDWVPKTGLSRSFLFLSNQERHSSGRP